MFVFFHMFSLLFGFAFPIFWELCGLTEKISPNSWVKKMWVFPSFFYEMGKQFPDFFSRTHSLGTIWFSTEYFRIMGICTFTDIGEFLSTVNLQGRVEPGKCLCFSYYSRNMGIPSSLIWDLHEFLLHAKYLRKP